LTTRGANFECGAWMHCNVPFKHPDGLRWLYRDWLPMGWLARTAIKKQLPALQPPALKE
jgi:hypothetical protein